jgi:hypothetical protein
MLHTSLSSYPRVVNLPTRGPEIEACTVAIHEFEDLVVPGHERGAPKIGDTLIPDLLPGQWTWIPKAWIGAQLQLAPT